MKNDLSKKSLIVFDLDGTLTKTKSDLAPDMSRALTSLLEKKKVAVIGGGSYRQFRKQFLANLDCPTELFKNLFLFPTTATAFYRYDKGWKNVYAHFLSSSKKQRIRKAVKDVFSEIGYVPPKKTYGKTLEDRGSQMSYSFLGQDVVAQLGKKGVRMKEEWTKKNTPTKLRIAKLLQKKLPDLEVHAAGFTTIDITQKGIDKAYGVRQIEKTLKIRIKDMVFIGDALYPGGNDAAAKKSGVQTVPTSGPKETIRIIKKILK
ncbi:MAG TPA: HAD-IIB family hydrolase [Candidatus Paceibacterota bacterium]|nr:HAD-IIB family hydrolase [Candidatus Paceibacterota bacterium]